ncbi:hypothetical protein PAP_04040 [Palaeococcus pacificus DY20341]|uniref:Prenyltransferase n=2 Tax=Palaeococcus TaxID=83867 RepID=A0A075LR67_9EURY|nr:hypothetical protein PAP_04040 [Palaeococcus pacificus DY20341]
MEIIPDHVINESFKVASIIRDPYFRSIAYAKMAYELYGVQNKRYKEAFTKAVEATKEIDNPQALIRSLIEIAKYLAKCRIPAYKKVFYQAFEMTKQFSSSLKDELTEEIIQTLIELKEYDEALYYAIELEDKIKRNDNFLKLLNYYLKVGKMRKAHFIINHLDDEPWRSIAAIETLKVHLKREEYGSAIKVLSTIKNPYWLSEGMRETAIYLKKQGAPRATLEKFIYIAKNMSENYGEEVLKNLLIGFGIVGEVEFALNILYSLPLKKRASVLIELTARVIHEPKILKEIMKNIDDELFAKVGKFVMDRLLENPAEEYLGVVEIVGSKSMDEALLTKVVTFYSKLGKYQKSIHLAQRISDNYLRSLAFGSIAVNLLKEGNVDRALEIALEVKHPKWSSWLMEELLIKILEMAKEQEIENDLEKKAKEEKTLWES